jgi:predicted naringenin-chalcone synthase
LTKNPYIESVGTAVPEHILDQDTATEFMVRHLNGQISDNRVRAVMRATGIKRRFTVLEDYLKQPGQYAFYGNSDNLDPFPGTAERMQLFRQKAPQLSTRAALNCLDSSSVKVDQITHLITVSCTGMYAPGLDIDLIKTLGLRNDIYRLNINFMGCYAAITGLRMARDICMSQPEANVLLICTELCSLHYQKPTDEDSLLANALFGDGSAAVMVRSTSSTDALRIVGAHSEVNHKGAEDMSWQIGNDGFMMRLSGYIPQLIKEDIRPFLDHLLHSVNRTDFNAIVLHPGGKTIIQHVLEQAALDTSAYNPAMDVLAEFGNMSSPTVLFVLKKFLEQRVVPRNMVALAFGPGLTFESIYMEYD